MNELPLVLLKTIGGRGNILTLKAREQGFFCLYCVLKMVAYEVDIIQNRYTSLRNFTILCFQANKIQHALLDHIQLFNQKQVTNPRARISGSRGVIIKAVYVCQDKPLAFHLKNLFSLDTMDLHLKHPPKTHGLKMWS